MRRLRFSQANTKLQKLARKTSKKVFSLDLLAGQTCPYANVCKSWVTISPGGTRKIHDSPDCEYRCYAASIEVRLPNTYRVHAENTAILKAARTTQAMRDILVASLPKRVGIVRLHSSGDFFSEKYFLAVLDMAESRPDILFYGYTKAIPFLIKHKKRIPSNLKLVASFGGLYDHLIEPNGLQYAKVVLSKYQARKLKLYLPAQFG